MTPAGLLGLPSAEEIMAEELMRPRPTLTAIGSIRTEKPLFPPVPRLGPVTEGVHPLYTTHFSPARRFGKTAAMTAMKEGSYRGLKATTIVYDEAADIRPEAFDAVVSDAISKAFTKTVEAMGRRLTESFERAITGTTSAASAIKTSQEQALTMDRLRRVRELNDRLDEMGIDASMLARAARAADSNPPPVAEPVEPSLMKSNDRWGLF